MDKLSKIYQMFTNGDQGLVVIQFTGYGRWNVAQLLLYQLSILHHKLTLHTHTKQEIWANAHEMRDSISLILYAGWLRLCPVIWAKIHSKWASQPKIAKNSLEPLFCGSRSFKVIAVRTRGQIGRHHSSAPDPEASYCCQVRIPARRCLAESSWTSS